MWLGKPTTRSVHLQVLIPCGLRRCKLPLKVSPPVLWPTPRLGTSLHHSERGSVWSLPLLERASTTGAATWRVRQSAALDHWESKHVKTLSFWHFCHHDTVGGRRIPGIAQNSIYFRSMVNGVLSEWWLKLANGGQWWARLKGTQLLESYIRVHPQLQV